MEVALPIYTAARIRCILLWRPPSKKEDEYYTWGAFMHTGATI